MSGWRLGGSKQDTKVNSTVKLLIFVTIEKYNNSSLKRSDLTFKTCVKPRGETIASRYNVVLSGLLKLERGME